MTNGIIVTEQGTSVQKSADFQRVLDSRTPLLEIHEVVDLNTSITIPAFTGTKFFRKVYDHNLGYIPAFEWFAADLRNLGTDYAFWRIGLDETSVYVVDDGSGGITLPLVGKLVIYSRDLTTSFASSTTAATPSSSSKTEYGMKNVEEGKRIDSNEYSDFTIHTETKALSIHMSGTIKSDETNEYTPQVVHKLGYMPTYLLYDINDKDSYFANTTGKNRIAYIVGPQYKAFLNGYTLPMRVYANINKITFYGVQAVYVGILGYIIFKDPLVVADV